MSAWVSVYVFEMQLRRESPGASGSVVAPQAYATMPSLASATSTLFSVVLPELRTENE